MKTWIFPLWIATLSVAVGLGYHFGKPGQAPQPQSTRQPRPVSSPQLVEVSRQNWQAKLVAVGNLTTDPDRESRLGSPVPGRVAEVYVSVGDHVVAGTPLALITSPEITRIAAEHHHAELRLAQAQASLVQNTQAIRLGDESRRPLEESRTEFVSSKAELEVRRSSLRLSQRNLQRVEGLFKLGVVSARDLEVARAEVLQARSREQQSAALTQLAAEHRSREQQISSQQAVIGPKLSQLKTDLELAQEEVRHLDLIMQNLGLENGRGLTLRAPRSGIVAERQVSLGQAVNAEQELFFIVDASRLWLWVHLQESDLDLVPLHSQASLHTAQDDRHTFPGRVSYLAPLLEPETRTLKARILVDNRAGKLKAGMFVKATFPGQKSRSVLSVPVEAVVVEGTGSLVFRAKSESFERVPVELGARHDEWVEVRSGLKEGDRVARRGQAVLEQKRQ